MNQELVFIALTGGGAFICFVLAAVASLRSR
jgi:hypothetical protein